MQSLKRRAIALRACAAPLLALAVCPGCKPADQGANTGTDQIEGTDFLQSWNDGPARQGLVEFVEKVTTARSPEFVPPAQRIAAFDNDGTLWAEQPVYFQLQFALDRVKALAPQHPEWKTEPPFASLLAGDIEAFLAGGEKSLSAAVAVSHAGMTTDEFHTIVADWLATARHPGTGRPYTEMVYQPMLEMLDYLRAHGFKTYIVSGGGVEFMRVFAEEVYGIPPEQVIGSQGKLKYEMRDGRPVFIKLPELQYVDDQEGKPEGIQAFVGRQPVIAFGNSDGDLHMLQWVTSGSGARLGVLIHHTDAEREWAYDRESNIGRLDAALNEAVEKGWLVVSMKDDWKSVFKTP